MPTSSSFEELDHRSTAMGEISLRRRVEPSLGVEVLEVKLGDEFLMSSLFTAAERELARLGLAKLPAAGDEVLDVLVAGLGLGYTARAALEDARVRSLVVVEALAEVIDWHERGLLPLSASLTGDERCDFVRGDFFALVAAGAGIGQLPSYDAVLVDIDHSPRHVLHPSHAGFYTVAGLRSLAALLRAGGVFALWSDDPPDDEFLAVVRDVFADVAADVVTFPNPLTGESGSATVYLAS